MVLIISINQFPSSFCPPKKDQYSQKPWKILDITFLPSSPVSTGDVQSPGMASPSQDFSFFYICLEKSVCYFIKTFKADLLLKLLPIHIRRGFSNMVYVKRCLELSMELKSRLYSHVITTSGHGKTSWKIHASPETAVLF